MPEMITSNDAHYAYDIVKTICTEVGPGLPGTPQERERADIIKKELESHLGAGNVVVEEFTVAPGAFVGGLPICALFMLIAALLNMSMGRISGVSPWLTAVAALALSVLPLLSFVLEFIYALEFVDPFFIKKQSVNVIGMLRRPGTEKVKRLLILSGHHDSALEHTWLRLLGYGFFVAAATLLIGFIVMLAMSIIQLAGLITGNAGIVHVGTLGWALLVYPIVPCIISALFFSGGRKNGGVVPGAVDNLSGQRAYGSNVQVPGEKPLIHSRRHGNPVRILRQRGSRTARLAALRRAPPGRAEAPGRTGAQFRDGRPPGNRHPPLRPERHCEAFPRDGEKRGRSGRARRRPVQGDVRFLGNSEPTRPPSAGPASRPRRCFPSSFRSNSWPSITRGRDGPDVLTIEPLLNVLKLALEWVRSGGE